MASQHEDRDIPAKYRMCRTYQHAWNYTTVKRDRGEYIQGLVCIRCGVERAVRISARDGDRLGSGGYDYTNAPGYLIKGGGPLTPKERSELRLAEVESRLKGRKR
jgi:hypothetical protein